MPSLISPFYEKELKAEKAAAPLYRAKTERMRMLGEAEALKAAGERSFLTKGKTSTAGPAPSKVPYLPEEHREGRLGEIMRASPEELEKVFERMPTSERPIHAIRGTEQSWFSPGTKREYGDLRTAMTGFRPQPAVAAKLGAEAENVRYGTEFKRSQEDVLAGMVKSRGEEAASIAEEAGLGVSEMRRDISRRDEAELIAKEQVQEQVQKQIQMQMEAEAEAKTEAAKPGRKMRPSLKRTLWSGYDTKFGIHTPGFGAPLKGWADIGGLLGTGIKKGYEYAFPRGK